MTIILDQIIEIIEHNIDHKQTPGQYGEIVGTVEAAEAILALIEEQNGRTKELEAALRRIAKTVNQQDWSLPNRLAVILSAAEFALIEISPPTPAA